MSAPIPFFGDRPKAAPTPKLRALVKYPGNILGGTGIEVTKANGTVTIDTQWNEFGAISAIPTSPTSFILTFDTATNAYVLVPSHLLGGAVAGIADVVTSGNYMRTPGNWVSADFVQNVGTAPVTRTMQNKARDIVSAADFGMSPSATAAANVTALTNAVATRKSVLIPQGVYAFSQFVWAPPFNYPQTIYGEGRELTKLQAPNGLNADFFIIGDFTNAGNHCSLRDLTLDGNGGHQSAGSVLFLRGPSYVHIDNVRIVGAYLHGILGYVTKVETGTPDPYHYNGTEVSITNCLIQNLPNFSDGGSARTGDGIRLDGDFQASVIAFCDINGGTPNNTSIAGIHLIGGSDVKIIGNNIWPETTKIWVQGASNCCICGNFIHSDQETAAIDGVILSAGFNNTISGNSFAAITGEAVRIQNGAANMSVTGNSIWSNHSSVPPLFPDHAIVETDSSDYNIICGNSIYGTFTDAPLVICVGAHTKAAVNTGVSDFNSTMLTELQELRDRIAALEAK